ncbi:protein kinase [Nostoc sp. PCC 7107]|uniref:protein kinase domain-containing protein n=1 Tax=Nostoc sp. PCC 7107 TaxID=317936 RepID=UPI00029ED9B9|nr:protein kinase [Nostoc sp. PCC 7107]AFY44597.1 WD-40 repeat-containing protein [Nostoc sp. PCC 7107]
MVWNPGQELFGRRYIIERKLGEGGVGITYLAKNQRGELRVIKTLREQILNHPKWIPHQDKLRHDFRDEALRLALCHHPHIVQVENVFNEGNLPCMAMEYIAGEDLGKRITEKGALPEAEALEYIRQIGEALILVHEKGLLHRDLKPSNIMMRAGKPEAVLIDFGLARQFISGAVQQHTQSLTPGYAPPEQYAPIEQRGEYIDVYALAATLYALLTGQLPMPAPARLQNFTLPAPKELNGSVSDRVNEAIMKGMVLNYKLRPQSVQEWLDLLGASPIPPTQPVISLPNTSTSWECVHNILGISGAIALSPKGDILVSAAGYVIHFFSSNTGQLLRTLSGYSGWVHSVAISSDGQILAGGCMDSTTKLWSVTTGQLLRTLSSYSALVHSVAISSDGQILANCNDNAIQLWKVSTGKEILLIQTGHSGRLNSVAISSDGQILASGSDDNTIKLWEVSTGTVLHRVAHRYILKAKSYARRGAIRRTILHNSGKCRKEILTLTGHSSSVNSVAISSDGQILASGSDDKTIKLWSVTTGSEIRTLSGHSSSVNSVAISSDGQILASGSDDKTIKLWSVTTGSEIRTLSGHSSSVNSVAISSDGQILASGSWHTIKLWSVTTGREILTLTGHSSSVNSVAISKDGQILASGSWHGTIKLWSVTTGSEIRTLPDHSDSVSSVAFTPDGCWLAAGGRSGSIKIWRHS